MHEYNEYFMLLLRGNWWNINEHMVHFYVDTRGMNCK